MNEPAAPKPAPRIAIVGAGPAGCYTAQFLRKRWSLADIVIYDRHDAPYGLIRYGVAPDHLGTKAIAKQFDRLFARDGVTFVGATDIGTDLTLDQLQADFDVVVLATGLWADRMIDTFHSAATTAVGAAPVAAAPLAGVYGAGRLTRLINGHPAESVQGLHIGRRTVIVGNGNVAVDLVRLMLTPAEVLVSHGVPNEVAAALTAGPLEHMDVVGRSPVYAAKFDLAMIRELGKLDDVRFTSDSPGDDVDENDETAAQAAGTDAPADGTAKADAIRELVEGSSPTATRTVAFHFGWTPDRVFASDAGEVGDAGEAGEARVSRVTFTATPGAGQRDATLELSTDSVCTAVGFTETEGALLRRDAIASPTADLERGLLADGLYCVGWFRRGPVGTIPANRADARTVADAIIHDVEAAAAVLEAAVTST
ncbi:FAD-dependent oxidoreductase [Subtercola endophyticus]|uniref:FAD-dependent oxidoreductase n=1 Tax=Subtercola endophyticus TaxID=2895559 RepID=UPI001E2A99CF|nr:FAD-dependent oxidoreductase [Subtercola endophyticus]UFS59154.1 FAD-dependent oxidoreductase [Subtercola endophyticus]